MYSSGFNLSAPRYHDVPEAGRPFWQDAERPESPHSVHVGQGARVDYARPFVSGSTGRALYGPRPTTPTMIRDAPQEGFRSTAAATYSAKQPFLAPAATGMYRDDSPALEPRRRLRGGKERFVEWTKPAETKPSVYHEDKACDLAGRRVEECRASDGDDIVRPSTQQEKTPGTTGVTSCKFAGCRRTPRYGMQGGPLNVCQDHKRKGMHCIRDGVTFIATRDGNAFRQATSGLAAQTNDMASTSAPIQATSGGANGSEVSTAADTPAPSQKAKRSPLRKPRVIIRKKCEITGCDVHPSYGDAGTWRARFCSAHREENHVKVKNRPCQFPGCETRPHYGFTGGRSDFCVAHKQKGMVHLRNEVKSLRNKEAKRQRGEVGGVERRGGSAEAPTHDKKPKEGRLGEGDKKRKVEGPATEKTGSCTENTAVTAGAKGRAKKRCTTSTGSPPRAAATPRTKVAWKEGQGLAPSEEMKLLQEARESARAAAEASGSGRRARAPSRKFLEASGRMTDKSAQWMTKEMREEQARIKRELKQQKRAAAAAGLKVGQVIETIAVPSVSADTGSEGSVVSDEATGSKVSWRKLTPAETLRAVGVQSAPEKAALNTVGREGTAEVTDVVTVDRHEVDEEAHVPAATLAAAPATATTTERVSETTGKFEAAPSEPTARQGSTGDEMASASSSKFNRKDDGGRQGAGAKRAEKARCNFESCSKKASYGVNGVVRYCKMHRIFGMHKIVELK